MTIKTIVIVHKLTYHNDWSCVYLLYQGKLMPVVYINETTVFESDANISPFLTSLMNAQ